MLVSIIVLFLLSVVHGTENINNTFCLWHNNSCVLKCPDGLIPVTSDCAKHFWIAQKTCDNPEVQYVAAVCGFSRCDCPDPTVLDTDTGICYEVDNCPAKHNLL